ncbi:MAG: NAD-dependent epimerase/dehydratase family protein [Candidatus Nanoarchaeia archaeon]|nr:NAD-dependent epimerase/dehydratase family protein [Candidatus Nanoarchaeia archaeon]
MKVGVTGARGFIGNNLCRALYEKGYDVVEMDLGSKYNLFDINSLKDFVSGLDLIYHLAAINRGEDSDMVNVNIIGTYNLLEAVKRFNKNAKVVLVSTFQIYGLTKEKYAFKENDNLNLYSGYGITKWSSEKLLKLYCQRDNIKGITLRLSNVYGPGCKPFYNSVIANFVYQALNDEQLIIKGNGSSSRDFIYVNDVIDAFLKAADYKGGYDIFNICSGISTDLNELVYEIEKILNKKLNVKYIERDEIGDFSSGDYSKSKAMLGFRVNTSITEGLKNIINYLRKDGY